MKRANPNPQGQRNVLVVVLIALAITIVIVEPFPEGAVLVVLTPTHGIDVGDLPALALLLVAGWLAF
jgi:hypothetical protein